jgi:uncharacterized DUF497 family protein
MSLLFESDPRKARSNLRKHRVNFSGTPGEDFPDEEASADESREIVGHSSSNRLRLVSFIEPAMGRVHIIRARNATAEEQRDYEEDLPN